MRCLRRWPTICPHPGRQAHARPGCAEGLPTAGQACATQAASPSQRHQWNARKDELAGQTQTEDSSRASREQDPEGQVSERGGRARGPVSPSNQGGRHLCPAATALSRPGPAGRALPPSAGWGTWPWAPCSGPGLVHLPVHDRQDRTPLGAASRRALNTHLGQYRHPVPRCRHAYFLCPHFLPQPRV